MFDRVNKILERIDELKTQFRSLSHRRRPQLKSEFADAMNKAQTASFKPADGNISATPIATPALDALKTADGAKDTPYRELILKYARQHGVDPELIKSLIDVESSFKPGSVSRKGAQGLMQLMPVTAKEMGVQDPFDPEQNISGGTRYLARLLQQNGGDVQRALAAYNAGPAAVRHDGGSPPFPETKSFVTKVLDRLNKNGGKG